MIDIVDGSKILSYYKDALDIRDGKIPYPRMARIYPTYACNFNCPHCLFRNENKTGKYIPIKNLKRIIDELVNVGVRGIEFCGGGEPLVYPYFSEVIKYTAEKKVDIGILTNGSLLDRHYKLLSEVCKYVRVSIDIPNSKVFKEIYKPGGDIELQDIYNNVAQMVRYRNANKYRCTIGIKSLISYYNYDDIDKLVELAKNTGVEYIQFKGARSCDNELSDDAKANVEDVIKSLRNYQGRNDSFIKGSVLKTEATVKCFMASIHTMIDAYGDVYICCYHTHRRNRHKIGNVLNTSFSDVWGSDVHAKAISGIRVGECNNYDCAYHNYNRIMEGILSDDKSHINFI